MPDLDAVAPQFRLAAQRWPEAPTLLNHYRDVSACYAGGGHGLIGTAKSFIECVCLTILGEFGKPMPCSDPSTTELLVEALKTLGLQNTRGASRVDKLLSAHNKMADALSEMRNANDPVAHGRDGFLDALTENECRAFLITADTILALLLSAYEGKEPNLQYTREPYDRFAHLNERIDRTVSMVGMVEDSEDGQLLILTLRGPGGEEIDIIVPPSKILYALDRTAYVGFLGSSPAQAEPTPAGAEAVGTEAVLGPMHASEPAPPIPEVVSGYQGLLLPLKSSFDQYLQLLGVTITGEPRDGPRLSDSLLATAEEHMGLDWTEREPLQSAMKVALRRTLVRFGDDPKHADEVAVHLVSWLRIQAVGLGEAARA
jgi:hypothetical protein